MNGGGAEREGDTESEAGSRLRAISPEPDAGLELTGPRDRDLAEVGRLTDCATQAPPKKFFFNIYLFLRQRETEHERGRGRERGRHRIGSRLQAPSQQPRARHGARML